MILLVLLITLCVKLMISEEKIFYFNKKELNKDPP